MLSYLICKKTYASVPTFSGCFRGDGGQQDYVKMSGLGTENLWCNEEYVSCRKCKFGCCMRGLEPTLTCGVGTRGMRKNKIRKLDVNEIRCLRSMCVPKERAVEHLRTWPCFTSRLQRVESTVMYFRLFLSCHLPPTVMGKTH